MGRDGNSLPASEFGGSLNGRAGANGARFTGALKANIALEL
jgi:hypothetical protein